MAHIDIVRSNTAKYLKTEIEISTDLQWFSALAWLASVYQNQGRWKEAEELGLQVVEASKRVLGNEHPDTLTAMANLASTFWNQGRWKETEELELQVVEARVRVLGNEHPSTLAAMANLASMYKKQEQQKEAELLGKESVQK